MASTIDKTNCNTGTNNEQYIEDAKAAGDSELASFFEELKSNSCEMAEKAKQLLKNRLN